MSDEEMDAAVDAVLSGRGSEPFRLADGTTLDLASAVRDSPLAMTALPDDTLSDETKRTVVHLAILQALAVR